MMDVLALGNLLHGSPVVKPLHQVWIVKIILLVVINVCCGTLSLKSITHSDLLKWLEVLFDGLCLSLHLTINQSRVITNVD